MHGEQCELCQKYGGNPAMHNAGKCSEYKKDSTLKPLWSSSKYLTDKTNKKAMKWASFEEKHYYSSNSYSNLE